MIGQTKLQAQVGDLLFRGKFPRFSIFIGDKGSGRKTFIKQTLGGSMGTYQECAIDVESVREVIEQAYLTVGPMIYVFPDADTMSVAAKNALLKVTEEPPNDALFIMTLVNAENTLQTIRSRASIFYMDAYTPEEILEYYHNKTIGGDEEIIQKYCFAPGDVDLLCSYEPKEFEGFILSVLENAEKVSGANSFKIGSRLNLGTDEKKYDLGLFWKAFRAECLAHIDSDPLKYIAGINITSDHMSELRVAGVNLQMAFDNWLLDLRKEWMQYAGD